MPVPEGIPTSRPAATRPWGRARHVLRQPAVVAGLVLAVSAASTFAFFRGAQATLDREYSAYFEFRARDAEARVLQRMQAYAQVLRGVAGLFAASDGVDRSEFRAYARSLRLEEEFPGIQGVGYAALIAASTRAEHLASVRAEGFPDYAISPEGERDPLTSIVYLEPFIDRNLRAFGYDMFSEPVRRAAMEQARDTGDAVLSGKVRLVQETGQAAQAGFLVYLPIYRNGAPVATVEERRASLVGWVYAPFRMDDLMAGILGEQATEVHVEIFDGAEPSAASLMYDADGTHWDAEQAAPELVAERELEVAGHRWTMGVRALPGLGARLGADRPRLVLAAGATLGALLSALVWLLARGRARALREATALGREMAERRRAEEALRESEALYRSLFTLAPSGVVLIDGEGRLLAFNEQVHERLGYTREEFARVTIPALNADTPEDEVRRRLVEIAASGEAEFEVRHRARSGELRDVLVRSRRVEGGPGTRLLAVWQDITERKRADEARRRSEERLRQTLEYASAGTWEWAIRSNELSWSPENHELFGVARGRPLAYRDWEGSIDPRDVPAVRAAVRDALATAGREYAAEYRVAHPTRGTRWVLSTGRIERDADGAPVRILGLNLDITRRKDAEEALRRSEAFYRALLAGSTDFLSVLDAEGRCRFVGGGATSVVGWTAEEILAQPPFQCVHPEDRDRLLRVVDEVRAKPGGIGRVTYRFRHKDGTWRYLETVGRNLLDDPNVRGIVVNRQDVTERRRVEEQFHEAQRLESVGRLAGGVAHDFNNLLTVILSAARALAADLKAGTGSVEDAQEVRAAAERARDLTRNLLAFARRQVVEPVPLDLGALVRESEKLLRRLLTEDIALELRHQADLWTVCVDPAQFEQILLNLAVNAGDAMPRGGTLSIETSNFELGEIHAPLYPDLAPGPYVRVAVQDTGSGMPPDVKARAFDPFFTTKEVGKGTGLGLATVWGIVRQSGGSIRVETEPGWGTSVELLLPRAQEPAAPVHEPRTEPLARGTETVMVVEDEPTVRAVTLRALRMGGYDVLEATDGAEALDLLSRRKDPIDLLVTDVVMPGMTGPQLAEATRKLWPGARVLLVSGHAHDVLAQRGALEEEFDLLHKPYDPGVLLARVRRALDGGGAPPAARVAAAVG